MTECLFVVMDRSSFSECDTASVASEPSLDAQGVQQQQALHAGLEHVR